MDNVKRVEFDLNTGKASIFCHAGKEVDPQALWRAVKEAGFTPVRVETNGTVYQGPTS